MIIRQASLDAFKQMAIAAFEEEMVKHCRASSKAICQPLGDEALTLAIRRGLEKARAQGFTKRGSSQFYLECMLVFGSGFATDPQYPWLAEALALGGFDEELHKAEAVHEKVSHYLRGVAGTDSRYVRGCLRRLLRMFGGELPVRPGAIEDDIARILDELHPEKSAYPGLLATTALIHHAVGRARDEYGLTGARSITLLAILMWLSGHACDEDPLYPWIGEALAERHEKGSEAAAALLERRAITFWEALLQEIS